MQSLTHRVGNDTIHSMADSKITTILFDLDGTLLPMDQESFIQAYFTAFTEKCRDLSFDPQQAYKALLIGVRAMMENDGTITNEQTFWNAFSEILDIPEDIRKGEFIAFYTQEFSQLQSVVEPSFRSAEIVRNVREKGYTTVLATTPVFPKVGTLERLSWAGLEPSWFDEITTYEYYSYAKPNLGYYQQIIDRVGAQPEQCLMIGNDVTEDLIVRSMGMQVFLVTDNLINRDNVDISSFPQGTLEELWDFCNRLEHREKSR